MHRNAQRACAIQRADHSLAIRLPHCRAPGSRSPPRAKIGRIALHLCALPVFTPKRAWH